MSRGRAFLYYVDPAVRKGTGDCPVTKGRVRVKVFDDQVTELVKRLRLPDDWRERLQVLTDHQEEKDRAKARRKYLTGKLRRLAELYLEGDFDKAEYTRRKESLQAEIDALKVPDTPEVEQAGKTLESLGAEWAAAPPRFKHEMLRLIFDAIYVDFTNQRLVCVKPYPPCTVIQNGRTGRRGR